jgi:hypothetical protein
MLATCALGWGITAYPAYLLGSEQAVAFSAAALLLCLVPAALTMLWAERTFRRSPEQFLMVALGGTGLRMFVVLAGTLAVTNVLPYFQHRAFWLWVLAWYLATLTIEMVFLLAGRASPTRP